MEAAHIERAMSVDFLSVGSVINRLPMPPGYQPNLFSPCNLMNSGHVVNLYVAIKSFLTAQPETVSHEHIQLFVLDVLAEVQEKTNANDDFDLDALFANDWPKITTLSTDEAAAQIESHLGEQPLPKAAT